MTESMSVLHIPKRQNLGSDFDLETTGGVLSSSAFDAFTQLQKLEAQLQEAKDRDEAILFETCLRKIWIVRSVEQFQTFEFSEDMMNRYKSYEAYSFLLEIICGLHSPVVGETEVFGQFKDQIVKQVTNKHPLFKLVRQLMTDAKDIRRMHLTHLGSQSYGSFCRRMILDKKAVDMVGFGSFAQSILPWVEKDHIAGRIFVRNAEKECSSVSKFKFCALSTLSDFYPSDVQSALIICAPIQAKDIECGHYNLIIDLRETSTEDAIKHGNVITLSDVFAEIEKGSEYVLGQKQLALAEVQVRAKNLVNSVILRPFGWDDICA